MKTLDQEILLVELQKDATLIVTMPCAVKYKGACVSADCIDGGGLWVENNPMPLIFYAGDQIKIRVLEHEKEEGIIDVEILTSEYESFNGSLAMICLDDIKITRWYNN